MVFGDNWERLPCGGVPVLAELLGTAWREGQAEKLDPANRNHILRLESRSTSIIFGHPRRRLGAMKERHGA